MALCLRAFVLTCLCLILCEVAIQAAKPRRVACYSRPCLNGGECYETRYTKAGYFCYCGKYHYGKNCESVSPCYYKSPCKNGSRCKKIFSPPGYYCSSCPKNYVGRDCDKLNPCLADRPCQNGGKCRVAKWRKEMFQCKCPVGFRGTRCEIQDPCTITPPLCLNGGKCHTYLKSNGFGYTCTCPYEYRGDRCQFGDLCLLKPGVICKNGGTCYSRQPNSTSDFTYSCYCTNQYYGDHCQIPNGCATTVCENGGTCYAYRDEKVYCTCSGNYTGDRCQNRKCQIDVRACEYPTLPDDITEFDKCLHIYESGAGETEQCHNEMLDLIFDSKSCDCRPPDVALLYRKPLVEENKWHCIYRLRRHIESSPGTCSERAKACGVLFMKITQDWTTHEKVPCNETNRHILKDSLHCLSDWKNSYLSFTGCDAYDAIVRHLDYVLQFWDLLLCSDCQSLTPQICSRFYEGDNAMCRWLDDIDNRRECFLGALRGDPECMKYEKAVRAFLSEGQQLNQNRYGQFCNDVKQFERTWREDWGCQTSASPHDVTKPRYISRERRGVPLL